MTNETIYLGNGWENQYGLNVSINIEKLNQAIATGKLEVNKYGDVKINVGKLKQVNEKSKATHFVAVPKPKNDLPF
ncbi:hypothetical protein UFOVP528_16 [uncultured Caudovirales phage]|uniref:Uncharacterized protein n=1 Tax=uncultured Caudovirales phage TaxID=2100421 RepID=A0A6J5MY33_9CAUD|nr:hypothetical protein UFOVP528_16 [uncultured Caudovirales phage]